MNQNRNDYRCARWWFWWTRLALRGFCDRKSEFCKPSSASGTPPWGCITFGSGWIRLRSHSGWKVNYSTGWAMRVETMWPSWSSCVTGRVWNRRRIFSPLISTAFPWWTTILHCRGWWCWWWTCCLGRMGFIETSWCRWWLRFGRVTGIFGTIRGSMDSTWVCIFSTQLEVLFFSWTYYSLAGSIIHYVPLTMRNIGNKLLMVCGISRQTSRFSQLTNSAPYTVRLFHWKLCNMLWHVRDINTIPCVRNVLMMLWTAKKIVMQCESFKYSTAID